MKLDCRVFILWISIYILCFEEQECCRFGPGPNCGFPCRCTGNNICDSDTGKCLEGLQCQSVLPNGYGWQGPGCRIGNVAYASTNVHQSGGYFHYSADLAVDGNTTPYITNEIGESCAHPLTNSDTYAWWWVDLGDVFDIQSVTLVNRLKKPGTGVNETRFRERSTHYDIKIGNTTDRSKQTLCFHFDKPGKQIQHIETMACTIGDMVGRYISFERTGGFDTNQAAICEFIVMGYKTIECHPNDCTGACDSVIGCQECRAGKMLPNCKNECPDGYWGVNCANICGRCIDGVVCDKVNGSCGDQCDSWYIPQLCTELLWPSPAIFTLTVSNKTSDSAILSWDRSTGYDVAILKYYYYIVKYKASYDDTDDWYTSNRIALSNETSLRYEITELEHNTQFTVHIESFRELNGVTRIWRVNSKEFTTLCTAPAIPPTPSIYDTLDRFAITLEPTTNISPGCDRLDAAVLIITCENSTHTVLNEIYDILIDNKTVIYGTTNVLSCSVVLFVTNNAGLSSASTITSVLTATTATTMTNLSTKSTETKQQQIDGSGLNITAIIVGVVCGVVVIILITVIVVMALRNMSLTSGPKPERDITGYGNPNPVYENTMNGDNDNMQTFNQANKQVTNATTFSVAYESTDTPQSQYASLDETLQTFAKPSPVYQELN